MSQEKNKTTAAFEAAKTALQMTNALYAAQLRHNNNNKTPLQPPQEQVELLWNAAQQKKEELLQQLDRVRGETTIVLHVLFAYILDVAGHGTIARQNLERIWSAAPAETTSLAWQTVLNRVVVGETSTVDEATFVQCVQEFAAETKASSVEEVAKNMVEQIASDRASQVLVLPATDKLDVNAVNKEARIGSIFSLIAILQEPQKTATAADPKDSHSTISFFYFACTVYAWVRRSWTNDDLLSSTKLLLLVDDPKNTQEDSRRRLDYSQFQKFLLSLSSTWKAPMENVLDDLTLAFTTTHKDDKNDEFIQEIMVDNFKSNESAGDSMPAQDTAATSSAVDALTSTRTRQLFELWDTNGDGDIDFSELLTGLRRYQQASSPGLAASAANAQAEKIALRIMGHDEDRNQTLDPEEFAVAMVDYAKAAETDLHQLIDFMCVVVQQESQGPGGGYDATYEKAYSEATLAAATHTRAGKAFRENSMFLMKISDIAEDEEEEEEEDDDE